MGIVGFVPNPESAEMVVGWVQTIADEDEETTFLCLETGFDGRTEEAVLAAFGEKGDTPPSLIGIDHPMPVPEILQHVRRRNVRLLVSAAFELPEVSGRAQTSDQLMQSAACQTFIPLYGGKAPSEVKRILLVATDNVHDRWALRLVDRLRQRQRAEVTIGNVEDETDAKAGHAGGRAIRTLLHDAVLDEHLFQIKVVTDQFKHRGIIELFEDQDLVVIGADGASHVSPLEQSLGDATVAIMKRPPPLRLRALTDWLPRINPDDHADLIHDLRQGSIWGPDFIGMLGLASAIASLGLLQNSPAVVIGSMLLAPLMTPMIGLGLALQQANLQLGNHCGRSIGFGFLLTLVISFLITIITPTGETLSEEVLARGGPNILDLFIAVFAAGAATFAMARPNIAGAIAGVAIATALVPPVCSIGISLASGELLNALGALALFVTNLLAIIVVSSFTFTLLGVTHTRALPRNIRRSQIIRFSLVVMLLVLAGPLAKFLIDQLQEGKHVSVASPVTWAVREALYERVAEDEGVELILLGRPRGLNSVMIQIASPKELPRSYADELRKIVREKMDDPELKVTVVAVRGFWRSDSDSP